MSYNSKAYLAHCERLLEPGNIVSRGTYRRYSETAQAAKNKWLSSLSPDDRQRLKDEADEQFKNVKYE